MKAIELFRERVIYAENKFADLVLWQLTKPVTGSKHSFKYRLSYIVNGECVFRYDNETGKGDHRHWGSVQTSYEFSNSAALLADFQRDIQRWNHENSDS